MKSKAAAERSFSAKIEGAPTGPFYVVLPFDPKKEWGARLRYHIRGTIDQARVRGALKKFDRGYFLPLGPAYCRDAGLKPGDRVTVTLAPEGPQLEGLAEDVRNALDAEPEAAAFFEGLATFYRKNYLRWVDATKRSPQIRAQRIEEMIALLKAGEKQRPG